MLWLVLVLNAATPEFYAKLGEGMGIKVGDLFDMTLRARAQVRYSHTEGLSRIDELMVRRARLQLHGRVDKDFRFYFQLGFSHLDMERDAPNPLRDAQISWTRFRDLSIRVGQGKVQFDKQRMTSSSSLSFADRSIVMNELTLDRDVGAEIFSEDFLGLGGRLAYAAGVWGGDGRNRLAPGTGVMGVLRVDYLPFGGFDTKKESDPERSEKPKLAFGAAVGRNEHTVRTRSTTGDFYKNGGFSFWHATADVVFKWHGVYFLGEWLYRQADTNLRGNEWSRSGTGFFVQGGVMVYAGFEVTARYGFLTPMGQTDPTFHRAHEAGGGANYYFFGHNLKITADYFWAANAHIVRLQTQLYF